LSWVSRLSWFPKIPSSLFKSLDYAHLQRSTARDGLDLSMVLVITAREGDLFSESGNSTVSLSLALSLKCVRTCTYVYIYVLYENAMSPFVITVFANLLAKHASARTQTHIHITHPQTTRTPPIARRV